MAFLPIVLICGLLAVGLYTLVTLAFGLVTPDELGLSVSVSWARTIGFSLAGLVVTVAYSPLADRLAARWFKKPPTLDSFRAIQQSKVKLAFGIVAARVPGGILEELVARGMP